MTVNQRLAQIALEHTRLVRNAMKGGPFLGTSERLKKIEPRIKELREERDGLMGKYPRNQRHKEYIEVR